MKNVRWGCEQAPPCNRQFKYLEELKKCLPGGLTDAIGEAHITAEGEKKSKSMLYVFVADGNKQPLDSCHPARAPQLLKSESVGSLFLAKNRISVSI